MQYHHSGSADVNPERPRILDHTSRDDSWEDDTSPDEQDVAGDLARGTGHGIGFKHQQMVRAVRSSALMPTGPTVTHASLECKLLMTRIEPLATVEALVSTLSKIKQSAQVVVRI